MQIGYVNVFVPDLERGNVFYVDQAAPEAH